MSSDDVTAEPVGLPRRDPLGDVDSRVPVEMLASEFLDALRVGKEPSVEEYISRFPEHAEELRRLLPLVVAMEDWKADKVQETSEHAVPRDLQLERLGDCQIIREIGRGGMGVVFEGIQEPLGRRVAVKLLPWRFGQDDLWRTRFQREARLAASLRHANIVPVFRFAEYEGFYYYVMPFIIGMGLDWVIDRLCHDDGAVYAHEIERARLGTGVENRECQSEPGDKAMRNAESGARIDQPESAFRNPPSDVDTVSASTPERQLTARSWKKIAKIGVQAASALRYAHGRGLLHRDIKPGNLLLDTSGTVWITDFGLAQPIEQISEKPSVAGTLRYMPPEQLEGHPDERSDIYSLGLTLYELVTLRCAFSAETRSDVMRSIREGNIVPIREATPSVPRRLADIITRAIAPEPATRYQSADELTSVLLACIKRTPDDAKPDDWLSRLSRRWWS